jgi:hypothetical protein
MGECHKCPHRVDVEAGKFRGVAFEKTPCAACELVEKSAFTMEFDEDRAPEPGARCPAGGGEDNQGEERMGEDRVPISVMSEAVAELLSMPRMVRDIVCWRYAGMKYREIAMVFGVTAKAIERRQQRAMETWPALKALFVWKSAKQRRRGGKPHGGERWREMKSRNSSAKRA